MSDIIRRIGSVAKRTWQSTRGEDTRQVQIGVQQPTNYVSNSIATGKYSIFTFVPLFLFSQFKRAANVFFLVISILQQVPNVSPTGQWTTLGPLMMILSISALREIAEDYRRQRDDDHTNNDVTLRMTVDDGVMRWAKTKWQAIHVGDILKIVSGRQFPADLILLASSEPKGMAYIETSNLDGETNLKLKQALAETANYTSDDEIKRLRGEVEAEAPTKHLYEFYGNIEIRDSSCRDVYEGQRIPIDASQLLLRGSQLRNTKFVYGLVIYTGSETKLMKNSRQAPLKQSNVEYSVNYQILYMFVALLTLSIISTLGNYFTSKWICYHWYLWGITDGSSSNFSSIYSSDSLFLDDTCDALSVTRIIKSLMTFLILYNNVVPISLLVTIEVVKYVQAILISFDDNMKYKGIVAKARTSNLNEELGQISYIFTDKTGTLTENIMEFKKCSIGGVLYSNDDNVHDFIDSSSDTESHEKAYQINMNQLKEKFRERTNQQENDKVSIFLRMMAVCQTVVPERNDNGEIEYQASSPDEAALVKAASFLGFKFISRSPNSVDILETTNGTEKTKTYRILHILEFNSTRKRMSVVVEDSAGKIIIFCKGADNVIYDRLSAEDEFSADERKKTLRHLEEFATVGLRTLCFAYSEIDRGVYEKWKNYDYKPASTSLIEREKNLDTAYAKIEKNFTLIGASAIEDRLQDQVPETIYMMRQAGISVWMLTGDKQETAINIGFSCNLIDQKQVLLSLDTDSLENTKTLLDDYRTQCDEVLKENRKLGPSENPKEIALIITGRTIKFVYKPSTRDNFMHISTHCRSVICCRVSPGQKADIVKAVRKEVTDSITLAIGDGANDVPMIQSAHIGIGISGQEGLQAANSSDYSIAQFRFLQRLLLVHGVCNYWRLVKCILYSFYKNITLYLIELWFAIFNGWSGQILFDRWAITCYNVLFTFWPPIVIGWFERPCEPDKLLKKPQLYQNTQLSIKFNGLVFWKMFLNSIVHSFLLFFLTFLCYSDMDWGNGFEGFASEVLSENGHVGGYLYLGNYIYTFVIITVLFKISLETSTWTFWNWLSVIGSGFLWILYVLMFGKFWPSIRILSPEHMAGQEAQVFSSSVFWLGCLIIPLVTILRDVAYKVYRYQTAGPDTFKNERNCDDRVTLRKFFKEAKTNIEKMAILKKTSFEDTDSRSQQIKTSAATPVIRTPMITTGRTNKKHRGFDFNHVQNIYNNATGRKRTSGYA